MLILTELEDSLWARAGVINIVLPNEGHGISVLISASLIQMLNSAVVKSEYIDKHFFFFYFQYAAYVALANAVIRTNQRLKKALSLENHREV